MLSGLGSEDQAPRLFRDLVVEPEEARSILRPQKDESMGFTMSLNPYRGCSHGCRYCYVRDYPAPRPTAGAGAVHDPKDWGGWISPKLNAPELLWAQRHRLHDQTVFISGATDPYQPIEREYRLTRKCLEILLLCPTTRVAVHTRSPLVLQDLDLLKAFGARLSVGFSVPTDDDTVRQVTEPAAPPIPSRWATMERLAKAGVRVGCSVAPLMAVHDTPAFVRRAKASGASSAWVGGLRLLKRDPFYQLLAQHGWLEILDPKYVEGVRAAFREAFPGHRWPRRKGKGDDEVAHPRRPEGRQPGLFDDAS